MHVLYLDLTSMLSRLFIIRTIDNKTSNIYVADYTNHCVKVFDGSGKILFKFWDSEGEGNMLYPRGLVICGGIIMICNNGFFDHFIHKYQLNSAVVSKYEIYICDCFNNTHIQIL